MKDFKGLPDYEELFQIIQVNCSLFLGKARYSAGGQISQWTIETSNLKSFQETGKSDTFPWTLKYRQKTRCIINFFLTFSFFLHIINMGVRFATKKTKDKAMTPQKIEFYSTTRSLSKKTPVMMTGVKNIYAL